MHDTVMTGSVTMELKIKLPRHRASSAEHSWSFELNRELSMLEYHPSSSQLEDVYLLLHARQILGRQLPLESL